MKSVTASAKDVALRFAQLALEVEEESASLTPMHLQKLVYLAQGWFLGIQGEPLFRESIQAWRHGPVVPELYQELKRFENRPVPVGALESEISPPTSLSAAAEETIQFVWSKYQDYSAIGLVRLTHAQAPWLQARTGVAETENSSAQITHSSMQTYFRAALEREYAKLGINLEMFEASVAEARAGVGVALDASQLLAGDGRGV